MHTDVNPARAVTMDDPAAVYAPLAAAGGMLWSPSAGLWIAAGPALVRVALGHPDLGVRPPDTPVPPALVGTAVGDLFGRLARMTDGDTQRRSHTALVDALDAVDHDMLRAWTRQRTIALVDTVGIDEAARVVAVQAVGHLLGAADDDLHELTAHVRRLVGGIAPSATDADIATAIDAETWLVREIGVVIDTGDAALASGLAAAFTSSGRDDLEAIIANAVGLLIQAHDATWSLIANAVLIARRDEVAALDRGFARHVAETVVPVQNTRRWAHRDTVVAGQPLRRGEGVLVLLATSGGDGVESLPFGYGRHACPGRAMAETIAGAALESLARLPVSPAAPVAWEPSGNVRIPRLEAERSEG